MSFTDTAQRPDLSAEFWNAYQAEYRERWAHRLKAAPADRSCPCCRDEGIADGRCRCTCDQTGDDQ